MMSRHQLENPGLNQKSLLFSLLHSSFFQQLYGVYSLCQPCARCLASKDKYDLAPGPGCLVDLGFVYQHAMTIQCGLCLSKPKHRERLGDLRKAHERNGV